LNLYCRSGALVGGSVTTILSFLRNRIGFDLGYVVIAHLKHLRAYLRAEAATDTEVLIYNGSFHFDASSFMATQAGDIPHGCV
jgi:hypothetical protein